MESASKVSYACELCGKVFGQKIDFTRHSTKKSPCISLEKHKEIIQTKESDLSNRSDLSSMFKSCLDILRTESIVGDKALRIMGYFLILKLIESKIESSELNFKDYEGYDFTTMEDDMIEKNKTSFFEGILFKNLAKKPECDLPRFLEGLWEYVLSVHPVTKSIFLKGKTIEIQRQGTYKKLVDRMASFDFSLVERDVLGEAYEEVIQDLMTGKVLGQFFTPPSVKRMMVKLISPQLHTDGTFETIFDPSMGTGGFLITAIKHLYEKSKEKSIPINWEFAGTIGLGGREVEKDTFQLAVNNMIISTGHAGKSLEWGDSIRDPIEKKSDIVLANMPFGIKGLDYDDIGNASGKKDEYIPVKTSSSVPLFLQAIVYMLKVGGRCAVVMPDGQDLFNKGSALVAVREYLMKTCDLKEIIYLPSGIFTHTSIKTCVFYFVKKREGTDVLEVKKKISSRSYAFSKTLQTTSVKFYDYNPYEDVKNLLIDVPIEKIAGNGFSLNYAEYLVSEIPEEVPEGVVMKTLGEVFGEKANNVITIEDDSKYKIVGLSSKGYSKISKEIFGKELKIKRQQLCNSSQFALSKILNGCYGFITNETAGGIISSEYWLFNINENVVLKKYIYYITEPQILQKLKKISTGLGIPRINQANFYNIKIPIPSLEKQREIVEYLDFIYEKANKTSLEKISELKQLNAFCLKSQTKFPVKTLGEVCEFKNGKRIVKDQVETGEYPVLGGGGITSFYTNTYSRDGKTCKISREGMSLHNCVMILNEKYYLNSQAFTIESAHKSLVNEYLWYYLNNNKEQVFNCGRGTAQKAIDIDKFKSIKIPIPPLEKQREIVEYCEFNDSLILQLEREIEQNKKCASEFLANAISSVDVEEEEEEQEQVSAGAIEEEEQEQEKEHVSAGGGGTIEEEEEEEEEKPVPKKVIIKIRAKA